MKIQTGQKVGILDATGDMQTHFVSATRKRQTPPETGQDFVYYGATEGYIVWDGCCILIDSQPWKFFYTEILGSRTTVAYKIAPDGVTFKYARCCPLDRFTKQAGRFYAMNAEHSTFLSLDELTAGMFKEGANLDIELFRKGFILECIEDIIREQVADKLPEFHRWSQF